MTHTHVHAGVQVQPQGLQIAPNLIVIGPYDTQIEPQVTYRHPSCISKSGSLTRTQQPD